MPNSANSIFKIGLIILLLGIVLLLSLSVDFYTSTMTSPYLSLAIFSAVIVLGMIRRDWLDLPLVLGGAIFLYILDIHVMGFKATLMSGFSFAGLAAFAVLGTRALQAEGEERILLLYGFLPVVLFVGSEWSASTLLDITERLHPKTFDLFLYSFDSSLRVPTSFLVGQFFQRWPWLWRVSFLFYLALPLPLALVYAAQLRFAKDKALAVMLAFLATGPLGVVFYNILPACGPIHLFGPAFPWHPLTIAEAMKIQPVPVLMKGARNAIPSLHMTWVLLVWWNSRGLPRWLRGVALAFVGFTFLATLGTGEHYFIDLVVAFPFSLMVQALCAYTLPFRDERRTAFLFGTFATLLWLGTLSFATRLFWISPIIPWTLVILTVYSSVFVWRRLLKVRSSVPAPCALAAAAGKVL
jgi:hypothetical protein